MVKEGDHDAMIIEAHLLPDSKVLVWLWIWPEEKFLRWEGSTDELLRALDYAEDTEIEVEDRPLAYGRTRTYLVHPNLDDLGVVATVKWDPEHQVPQVSDLGYEEEAAA